jgi:alkylhydroperoxidase family enzyme
VARIPLIDPEDSGADPTARRALREWIELTSGTTTGRSAAPNVIRAMANHPDLLFNLRSQAYGPHARITPTQRELAYLTASVANSCHY